jgi:hypothetical protein
MSSYEILLQNLNLWIRADSITIDEDYFIICSNDNEL